MADGYSITVTTSIAGSTAPKYVDAGVVMHVAAAFLNSVNVAANPATVKFAYRADAVGVTTTLTYGTDPALVRSSTGNYFVDIDTNESGGRYEWNFYATGNGQAADHGEFYVRPTAAV